MFTNAIKEIKKAIKAGKSVVKEQTSVPNELACAIYVDGKLAVIISQTLLSFWQAESKKAKLNISLIISGTKGIVLI